LAAKTALSIRMDALGEKDTPDVGLENRLKVENRLRQLEGKQKIAAIGPPKTKTPTKKHEAPMDTSSYNESADSTMAIDKDEKKTPKEKKGKKEKVEEKKAKKESSEEEESEEEEEEEKPKPKKSKKEAKEEPKKGNK